VARNCLIELEREAAEEGRQYGREKLRQRLQAIAEAQGLVCVGSGEHLQDARFRNLPLITTLGKMKIRAHYGYDRLSKKWTFAVRDLWGLACRQEISPELEQQLGYTATECGSYKKAQQMAGSWGVKIGSTTIHKHVQRLGHEAQRQQELRTERALNPLTRGEVTRQAQAKAPNALKEYNLVISIDAWKGRERGEDWGLKPADAPGKRIEWRDLKLAVIYRLDQLVENALSSADPATRPRREILQKFWVAAPSGTEPEEFGRHVHAEALRRGMAHAKYIFLVCDGAVWIWNIIEDRFQSAIKELDFYHGAEHLWEVARDLYPEPGQAKAWVQPLLHQLRHGQEAKVVQTLESLPQTLHNVGGVLTELVQREITYFQNHREHLHYQDNAAKGFPVGSGAVESGCSQFQDRFKRTGQFWNSVSMGTLQALKVARHNGDWDELCHLRPLTEHANKSPNQTASAVQ
jgi:Uncharacterised protein family (UPF0236)